MIDGSIKEAQVFTETIPEKQTTIKQEISTDPIQVDIKKTQESKQETITKKIELTDRAEQINKRIQEA